MIHVALVSAYPTETEARRARGKAMPDSTPYLGIWTMPLPNAEPVHVFGADNAPDKLSAYGWAREDA
ncbi:hypothetical protein Ait01nite_089620 [Actinoplanes italicus]|uniref:Uncharacterized protein n=1 Tax=Actinoplanes italicus TaxID=113567 RepID=A0A2T0JIH2_9ACTN|nr:hypothetical protein [Actinoplanes italicus]PRX07378.1 hypothetical protein CLV67_14253 [Actinoplanes italicus]GIE35917.1 hypothetical protein Ait01nite_089620 [Actinoplanes italicus]